MTEHRRNPWQMDRSEEEPPEERKDRKPHYPGRWLKQTTPVAEEIEYSGEYREWVRKVMA